MKIQVGKLYDIEGCLVRAATSSARHGYSFETLAGRMTPNGGPGPLTGYVMGTKYFEETGHRKISEAKDFVFYVACGYKTKEFLNIVKGGSG